MTETEVVLTFATRKWRIRGLPKNLAVGVLKVNVMVSENDMFHVDTLDLYQARSRGLFVQQAAPWNLALPKKCCAASLAGCC